MKSTFVCIALLFSSYLLVVAQDKPQVFVQGQANASGSSGGKLLGVLGSKAGGNPDDDAVGFGKILQEDCPAIAVTSEQANADYTVTLTSMASKKNRDLRASGQVQVANRAGKIIGTNYLHKSGNAAKDACELITADGKTQDSTAGPVLTPGVTQPAQPAVAVAPKQAMPESVVGRSQTSSSTGVAAGGSGNAGEDLGEAARHAKQHAACLKLARENPNITCK